MEKIILFSEVTFPRCPLTPYRENHRAPAVGSGSSFRRLGGSERFPRCPLTPYRENRCAPAVGSGSSFRRLGGSEGNLKISNQNFELALPYSKGQMAERLG